MIYNKIDIYENILSIIKKLLTEQYMITNKKDYIEIIDKTTKANNKNDCLIIYFYDKYISINFNVSYHCEDKEEQNLYYRNEDIFVLYDEWMKVINVYKKFLNKDRTNCVMLGGSFNPMTNGHYQMAKELIDYLEDSYAIFVPTCDNYIQGHKKYTSKDILSEKVRYEMITMATLYDRNILVDDIELLEKREKSKTFRTLCLIKERYLPNILYFTVGSDDIGFMSKWWNIKDMIKQFPCIIITRTLKDIQKEILQQETLKPYAHMFRSLTYNTSFSNLSSTIVREYMRNHNEEKLKETIPLGAYEYLQSQKHNHKQNNNDLLTLYLNK